MTDLLKRAQDSQGRAQLAFRARLDGAFAWAPEDVGQGPGRVSELAAECVGVVATAMVTEIRLSSQRAVDEIVAPILKRAGGRLSLPKSWERRAGTIATYWLEGGREKLETALKVYHGSLQSFLADAAAMRWDAATIQGALEGDIRDKGPRFGAFRSTVTRTATECAGHAWTATWEAAWYALDADPSVILRTETTHFRVIDGGKSESADG